MKLTILKMLSVSVFMNEIMKNDRDFTDLSKPSALKDILGNSILVSSLKTLSNTKSAIRPQRRRFHTPFVYRVDQFQTTSFLPKVHESNVNSSCQVPR